MDFKQKYLKYKNKYLSLKNNLHNDLKGGLVRLDVNLHEKMQEFVTADKFIEHNLELDDAIKEQLESFFNKITAEKYDVMLPVNFNEYVGVTDFNQEHFLKIWRCLNDRPESKKTYNLPVPIYKRNGENITTFIPININETESQDDFFKRIFVLLSELKYKDKFDYDQCSGCKSYENPYLNISETDYVRIRTRIQDYSSQNQADDKNGTFSHRGINYEYKYYSEQNLLFVYRTNPDSTGSSSPGEGEHKLFLFSLKKNENRYDIFPYPLANILLRQPYENTLIELFTNITTKLNQINTMDKYFNYPDCFFHIHFTNINQNYILLTLHALYEITNQSGDVNVEWLYDGQTIERKTNKDITTNYMKYRKPHSFYILVDRRTSSYYLYQINNVNNVNEFFIDGTIGIKEVLFGNNIFDINYIQGKGVILTSVTQICKMYCDGVNV